MYTRIRLYFRETAGSVFSEFDKNGRPLVIGKISKLFLLCCAPAPVHERAENFYGRPPPSRRHPSAGRVFRRKTARSFPIVAKQELSFFVRPTTRAFAQHATTAVLSPTEIKRKQDDFSIELKTPFYRLGLRTVIKINCFGFVRARHFHRVRCYSLLFVACNFALRYSKNVVSVCLFCSSTNSLTHHI